MDDEDEIQAGDVVSLKSGGAQMSVEDVAGTKASCVWMTAGQVDRDSFPVAVLRREGERRAKTVKVKVPAIHEHRPEGCD